MTAGTDQGKKLKRQVLSGARFQIFNLIVSFPGLLN
jgi:hypothetical protein